jgi:hypothetical protein
VMAAVVALHRFLCASRFGANFSCFGMTIGCLLRNDSLMRASE